MPVAQKSRAVRPARSQVLSEIQGGEAALSLSGAARLPMLCRDGRGVDRCTVWRWSRAGVNGVKLEVARLGAVTVTTGAAVKRFLERLSRKGA